MFTYQITFTGFATHQSIYRNQQITLQCTHNWDYSEKEGMHVLFLARKEIKKHFLKFSIISVEKLG
jgi:hypothetical protein